MLSETRNKTLSEWVQERNEEQALEWLNELGFCFPKPQTELELESEAELPKAA